MIGGRAPGAGGVQAPTGRRRVLRGISLEWAICLIAAAAVVGGLTLTALGGTAVADGSWSTMLALLGAMR